MAFHATYPNGAREWFLAEIYCCSDCSSWTKTA
jgi:hypothetical protein